MGLFKKKSVFDLEEKERDLQDRDKVDFNKIVQDLQQHNLGRDLRLSAQYHMTEHLYPRAHQQRNLFERLEKPQSELLLDDANCC